LDFTKEFKTIFKENIKRSGCTELLNWLEGTDFFVAPASAKFHCAYKGGLVEHSVNVYKVMIEKHFCEQMDNSESFAICALLHDLCKIHFYKVSMRNVKDENTGVWKKQSFYMIDDSFPFGHGEKSVFLIERFMKLATSEAMAIRWHMGGFDESVKGGSFAPGLAYERYPLAVKLAVSDLESTYINEKKSKNDKKFFIQF
jgi:hypothetical protein